MSKDLIFTGSGVALVTPFNQDGVDYEKPVLLGYTGVDDENMRKYLAENTAVWPEGTQFTNVCAAIGVHVGPGVVAVAFFKK